MTTLQTERLLAFNTEIIGQALKVVDVLATHKEKAVVDKYFGEYAGPHLRHILEHYEALVAAMECDDTTVNYDARKRDRSVENSIELMSVRYRKLEQRLGSWATQVMQKSVNVSLKGGLEGEVEFLTESTVGREMMFLASHAIHHFALVRVWCLQHGILLGENFGKAPATVAYELANESA